MIRSIALCACLLCASPAIAQEDDGPSLIERGAQMFLEGLLQEMEPALDDMQDLAQMAGPALMDFLTAMGPALTDLFDEVKDWSRYEAPEILENGDIIIRRKPDTDAAPSDPQIDI